MDEAEMIANAAGIFMVPLSDINEIGNAIKKVMVKILEEDSFIPMPTDQRGLCAVMYAFMDEVRKMDERGERMPEHEWAALCAVIQLYLIGSLYDNAGKEEA
jgi:hypothetical protein